MPKICKRCNISKELTDYNFQNKKHNILEKYCKSCRKEDKKRYYANNTEAACEKSRQYYKNNKEKKREYGEQYRKNNKESLDKKNKEYRILNAHRKNEKQKEYNRKNKEKVNEYVRNRFRADQEFKILCNLRNRVRGAIKRRAGQKAFGSMELLGCDIQFVIKYLESKFQPGMTWENHGVHGWHIDHIRPCASFDLTDAEQQRICFHYTNLQPLWAEDNLAKRDIWTEVV